MINFIIKAVAVVLCWLTINLVYILTNKKYLYLSGKVVKKNGNLLEESLVLLGNQITTFKTGASKLFKWALTKKAKEDLANRKFIVLSNTVNHLRQTLANDLGIKTNEPIATTDGNELWVYLAKKLVEEYAQKELEEYISGILSKYTNEFAIDNMFIERISGAGWVAKCSIQPADVAAYNRMARASEVVTKEDFEDVVLW